MLPFLECNNFYPIRKKFLILPIDTGKLNKRFLNDNYCSIYDKAGAEFVRFDTFLFIPSKC